MYFISYNQSITKESRNYYIKGVEETTKIQSSKQKEATHLKTRVKIEIRT
jgi:hypothetical protein